MNWRVTYVFVKCIKSSFTLYTLAYLQKKYPKNGTKLLEKAFPSDNLVDCYEIIKHSHSKDKELDKLESFYKIGYCNRKRMIFCRFERTTVSY